MKATALATTIVTLAASTALADLRLPAVIGDHMVLQRDTMLPVWGWAEPGQRVRVEIAGMTKAGVAGENGQWRFIMPPLPAGGPHEMTISTPDETITLRDVLVGEVWLCSGQSNMEWSVGASDGGDEVIASERDPMLRLMMVEKKSNDETQDDVSGRWMRCESDTVGAFSGVGYFMGRRLRNELGVPVGLIQSAYGGSPAEAWMPRSTLGDEFPSIIDDMRQKERGYEQTLAQWQREAARAEREGRDAPPRPQGPFGWADGYKPGGLWNAMLRPLAPYAIAGAVWYQGESNVGRAEQYARLLPAMIRDWREAFGQPDMPFGIVQLANFSDPTPGGGSWPELREAQAAVADADPRAGLIVTIDCGDPTDIHPTDKKTVGDRLARWALAERYEKPVVAEGPVCIGMRVEGDRAILTFDTKGRGLTTRDGKPPRGFAIAAASGWWRWSTGTEIQGDELIVTGRWINDPAFVHYAWDDNPFWANLCNKDGLPARPFRSERLPQASE